MRRTLAAIALLGFSGAASAAPADDSETERTTLLRIISEGTAAIAAAAACAVDKDRIDRATTIQSDLIRAAAVRIGYADPEVLIKIRDEGRLHSAAVAVVTGLSGSKLIAPAVGTGLSSSNAKVKTS